MKFSFLYSNTPEVFEPVKFNSGLNVIYARVHKPKEDDKDSHNLGKTTLIHLLDFMLLKRMGKGHFLYDQRALFSRWDFYLEIALNSGSFVTIKRSVSKPTKISIKLHSDRLQNFTLLSDSKWDYIEEPIEKAIEILDGLLDLSVLRPYGYRKGISYFLRTQGDYLDVFQLSKFSHGKHAEWKPFMAHLLGFPYQFILDKYALDEEIDRLLQFEDDYKKKSGITLSALDRIKGLIQIQVEDRDRIQVQIDAFNFRDEEANVTAVLLNEIDPAIAYLNDRLYTIKYELEHLPADEAVDTRFDIDRIKRLFAEVSLYFPDDLTKSYEDLMEFNRRLLADQNSRRLQRRVELDSERAKIEIELDVLNSRRQQYLSIIQAEDWFLKFKELQAEIGRRDAEIMRLRTDLDRIDVISRNQHEIQQLAVRRQLIIDQITGAVNTGNAVYGSVRSRFNAVVRGVLDLPALLATTVNRDGNLDFEATLVEDDESAKATSESKGTTYKKLLCAAFDMALLETYFEKPFYRFVYHDGILEGLDNRKKLRFLSTVRECCDKYNVQYIMSLIEADLPRDDNDARVVFARHVIVKQLHDDGDDGRLFKMAKF